MASTHTETVKVSASEFAVRLARPQLRIVFIAVVAACIGLYRMLGTGANGGPLLVLLSLVAVGGAFGYGYGLLAQANNGGRVPDRAMMFIAGLAPWLFGVVLTVYEGLWSLWLLFDGFSGGAFVVALLFLYMGYRAVVWSHDLSEMGAALSDGRVIVYSDT